MSNPDPEAHTESQRERPHTVRSLVHDLRALGLTDGNVVLVHTSLSALGWVAGGAQAVILALLEVVGTSGTVMMPTHTGQLSDPSRWHNPPVPESWWQTIRDETPAFDPALTPSGAMGAVAETFRKHPRAIRSAHPLTSFAAVGPAADALTRGHALGCGLGEESPIGRLNRADGHVLLLGAGHANNTSLHLAEYRAGFPNKRWHTEGSPVLIDGQRRWVTYDELVWTDDDFAEIGAAFGKTGAERSGEVGAGIARLMRQRGVVDFAAEWMERHRR